MFANISSHSGLVLSGAILGSAALFIISIGLFADHIATQAATQAIERGLLGDPKACRAVVAPEQGLLQELLEPIKPFLAPGAPIPTDPTEVQELYAAACALLEERERYARQEAATIEAQNELQAAQAKADFLSSLSQQERALLDLRLKAQAQANEALASEHEALLKQHAALSTQVDALVAGKEALESENAQLRQHVASTANAPQRPRRRHASARRPCVCEL